VLSSVSSFSVVRYQEIAGAFAPDTPFSLTPDVVAVDPVFCGLL
jgi:hypothetical protein